MCQLPALYTICHTCRYRHLTQPLCVRYVVNTCIVSTHYHCIFRQQLIVPVVNTIQTSSLDIHAKCYSQWALYIRTLHSGIHCSCMRLGPISSRRAWTTVGVVCLQRQSLLHVFCLFVSDFLGLLLTCLLADTERYDKYAYISNLLPASLSILNILSCACIW